MPSLVLGLAALWTGIYLLERATWWSDPQELAMWYFFVDAAGVLISVAWVVGTVAYWAGRRSRVGPGMPTVGVVDVLLINSTSHPVLMLLAGLWAVILLLAILMHSLAVVFDGVLISLMIAVGALVVRTTRKLLR